MTPGSQVILNGEVLPHDAGRLPVETRMTLFSESAYEVIRFYDGKAFRMQSHLDRLARSLAGIGLDAEAAALDVDGLSQQLIERNATPNAVVYWQVGAGAAPRELAPAADPGISSFAVSYETPRLPRDPLPTWKAITTPDQRWHRCDIKTTMLLPNLIALREAHRQGCDAAIFSRGAVVTEANTANCFAVLDGVLRTHPANQWILDGVTRIALLECVRELGLPFLEQPVLRRELLRAEEVFLCGTMTQLTAITEIDGHAIGDAIPGAMSTQLYDALRNRISEECELSP